jgi:hypothetical protein
MKKLSLIIMLLLAQFPAVTAQVAINADNAPNGNLLVAPDSYTAPSSQTGVLVPKVHTLEMLSPKPDGLLVYLDNPTPPLSTGETNGFYYWSSDLNKWVHFISRYSASIEDQTVFSATGNLFRTAPTDCVFYNTAASNKTIDYINMTNLKVNDPTLCQLSADGRVRVLKAGWYYIQLAVSLTNDTNPAGIRDILCVQLQKNGTYVYFNPPTNNIIFRGFNSYAAMNLIGQSFVAQGPVQLAANDILSLSLEIIYMDKSSANDLPNPVAADQNRVSAKYTVTTNTLATLVGRYMGNY